MKITQKEYNNYLHMAVILSSKDEANDLLQETLMKIERLNIPDEKLTANYIFISLKRMNYDMKNKENRFVDNPQVIENLESEIEEEIDHRGISDRQIEKLDFVGKVIKKLHPTDIKLYNLHFTAWNEKKQKKCGYSQREIARRIGVSHQLINNKIKSIVKLLNDEWDNYILDKKING